LFLSVGLLTAGTVVVDPGADLEATVVSADETSVAAWDGDSTARAALAEPAITRAAAAPAAARRIEGMVETPVARDILYYG
jgi:hypothetical protein